MPTDGGAAAVWDDPAAYLAAITVMFKRPGFDPDNQDWFWARYAPDGSLAMTEGGVAMVGRVDGCIGCHSAAGGGDYIYVNDWSPAQRLKAEILRRWRTPEPSIPGAKLVLPGRAPC